MQSLTVEVSDGLVAEMDAFIDNHPEYPDRNALVREALCREVGTC